MVNSLEMKWNEVKGEFGRENERFFRAAAMREQKRFV